VTKLSFEFAVAVELCVIIHDHKCNPLGLFRTPDCWIETRGY
jgi:hypothetical protein